MHFVTGQLIEAATALRYGLVQRVVPRARLDAEAAAVAARLAAQPEAALRGAKEAMVRGADLPLEAALRLESMIAMRVAGGRGV